MLATACGYTYAEIDEMMMWQFEELAQYWRDHPPAHLIAAARAGIKPPKRAEAGRQLFDLLGVNPETGGAMRPH